MRRKKKEIINLSRRHFRRLIYKHNRSTKTSELNFNRSELHLQPLKESAETNKKQYSVYIEGELHNEFYDNSFEEAKYHSDENENDNTHYSNSLNVETTNFRNSYDYEADENKKESYELESNTFHIKQDLALWAIKHNISHTALSDLLIVLRKQKNNMSLPKDARSLLQTPRVSRIKTIDFGYYCHFGIQSAILNILSKRHVAEENSEIQIKVGIDGLPLSNSNSSQLWPILGSIYLRGKVFVIGEYHGYAKPANSDQFLQEFADEMIHLTKYGVLYEGVKFNIRLRCIICDAPAKSFITKTKGHTGYFGCTKCIQEGEYIDRRICFPEVECLKRTDESFALQVDEDYHLGQTILTNIPNFGLVSQVPLDYMHLVCIGVVKKMIGLWLNGSLNVRLQHKQVLKLSMNLVSLRSHIPKEFARRPQEIKNFSKWKATELRQFLLYTSPVVLFYILPKDVYEHVLSLHIAVRILCNNKHIYLYGEYAHNLLKHFIQSFQVLYGRELTSHNVHGLCHLLDDVNNLGPLDNFSAFPFENYMRTLKHMLRKHEKPLQQLYKRYTERDNLLFDDPEKFENPVFLKKHLKGPLLKNCIAAEQFEVLKTDKYHLLTVAPDNCCTMKQGIVVLALNFVHNSLYNSMMVIGKRFLQATELYGSPCSSTLIDCVYVKDLSEDLEMWSPLEISCKCLKIPHRNGYAIFPILHTDS